MKQNSDYELQVLLDNLVQRDVGHSSSHTLLGEDAAPVTSIALAPAMHPEAELAQLRERLAAMRASVAAMQQEHDAMQQERDDSRAEVARLTTTVAQMTERTAHVRDAFNILERKYDSSKVRSRGGGVPQYVGARDRIVET